MASNVNFGPEWMRRAAKPANVNTTAPAVPSAALPSPKAPLSNHPAFAKDRGQGLPTLRGDPADPTSPTSATSSAKVTQQGNVTTTVTQGPDGAETIEEVTVEEYVESDRPNPYRYDKKLFLSLWKDIQSAALPGEELDPVWSEEVLSPTIDSPLTELEERIIASGTVNSEVTTRRMQGAGARRNTGGSRGQMQGQRGNRDYERGFREFINKVQTTDERPVWAYGQTAATGQPAAAAAGGGGFFDAGGAYHYNRAAGGTFQDPSEVLWFYRDPQGNIQGPFTGADMHEWYKAGFFTAQLLVKRESDPQFIELGMLVQILGNDEEPFLVPIPPPAAAPEYGYSAPADAAKQPPPPPQQQQQQRAPAAATAAAATAGAAPVNTKSRGAQSDLLRNISKELENAGGEDVKMWSKLGQPGPVPKSLREIQEDAKKKGGK